MCSIHSTKFFSNFFYFFFSPSDPVGICFACFIVIYLQPCKWNLFGTHMQNKKLDTGVTVDFGQKKSHDFSWDFVTSWVSVNPS